MKTFTKPLFTLIFLAVALGAFAQTKGDVKALIDQGIALNDSGKYNSAIDKYKQALSLDSTSLRAKYELSYTLASSGRPKEAIPYLEQVAASNTFPEAYDLLASIYDDTGDYDKAVAYYKEGMKAFPKFQRLYFNLAISYLRQKKYADAETNAITAIKLDPKHASSQRVYAIATYDENKRGCSLLAWCSFLTMEPLTQRSPEAYKYVQAILNYGIKREGEKKIDITISDNDLKSANLLMPMAIATATDSISKDGERGLTSVDSLALQLTSLFKIATSITGEKEDPFILNYFSKYFEKLGNSDNMAAFARVISLSVYKEQNLQWFKDNDGKLAALDNWIADTKREAE